ncbi:MAG: LysM domain-containing protein [Spirosomataceae bacterium]
MESGQTWYAVMRKYKVNIKDLRDANPGVKDNLSVGQIVRVPSANRSSTPKTMAQRT